MKAMAKTVLGLSALAFVLAFLVTAFTSCNAKQAEDGARLLLCIDEELLNNTTPEIILAKCGPDATQILIDARKGYLAKRAPCTVVVIDAGTPDGPGR
jgi:hypothetical protein